MTEHEISKSSYYITLGSNYSLCFLADTKYPQLHWTLELIWLGEMCSLKDTHQPLRSKVQQKLCMTLGVDIYHEPDKNTIDYDSIAKHENVHGSWYTIIHLQFMLRQHTQHHIF